MRYTFPRIAALPHMRFLFGASGACTAFLFAASLMALSGCETINPKEAVPTYVYMKRPIVRTDYVNQGTDSALIPDLWLTLGSQLRGAYPAGRAVPLLPGTTNLLAIDPGIVVNGSRNDRFIYPFYTQDSARLSNTPGHTDTIQPTFHYLKSANFALREDFDGAGIDYDDSYGTAQLVVTPANTSDAYQGQSGMAILDAAHPNFKAFSRRSAALPVGGVPSFAEINYKCSTNLVVGIGYTYAGVFTEQPYLILYATDHWKKVYVNLSKPVGLLPSGSLVKLALSAEKPTDQTEARVWLDNIKVVY